MHRHTVNYLNQEGHHRRGTLADRGFWVREIPRPLLACRVFGHKPVVDGTKGFRDEPGARWVCCNRCGTRAEPQGVLNPAHWNIGDRYDGPFDGVPVDFATLSADQISEAKKRRVSSSPGPWPKRLTWTFGGQAILGRTLSGFSFEMKVGNRGSEHTLAAHIRVDPIGALYLHTEDLGTWLQRRLNPTGYESRVTGIDFHNGALHWKLWAKRDGSSIERSRWQAGTLKLDPRDKLLGRRRYWHTDEGDPVTTAVYLPHGDGHHVTLQLQKQEFGREKLRRRKQAWTVDWDSTTGGIPTKPGGRGRISGFHVDVSDAAVRNGTWPVEASAAIASKITAYRTREGMREVATDKVRSS